MAQMLNASRAHMGRSMSPGAACKLLGRIEGLEPSLEGWEVPMAQGWTSWGVVGRFVRIIDTKSSPSFSPARTQSADPWEELISVSDLQLSWLPWCTFLSSPAFHGAQYELLWWPQIFQPRWTHMGGPFCCFLQLSLSHASHLLQQFFLCIPWWWEVPSLWDSKTGPQGAGCMKENQHQLLDLLFFVIPSLTL